MHCSVGQKIQLGNNILEVDGNRQHEWGRFVDVFRHIGRVSRLSVCLSVCLSDLSRKRVITFCATAEEGKLLPTLPHICSKRFLPITDQVSTANWAQPLLYLI